MIAVRLPPGVINLNVLEAAAAWAKREGRELCVFLTSAHLESIIYALRDPAAADDGGLDDARRALGVEAEP